MSGAGFGSQASVTLWANRKGDPNANKAKIIARPKRAVGIFSRKAVGKKVELVFVRGEPF